MRSNVNIAGHPLHPILVLIPAGAWITSFVLDIIFLATGSTFWFVASLWVIVIGIGGALLAALAGLFDLLTLPMGLEPRRLGLWHMTLNLIIVGLYVINVAAVRAPALATPVESGVVAANTAFWAFFLNLVAIVLLLASGWLGGEMVYRYGIAVPEETLDRALRSGAAQPHPSAGLSGSLGGSTEPEVPEEENPD